ncbi:gluconokinase [Comamonas humi]
MKPTALVVMGVSGCGKSSAAAAVAEALGWELLEGDAFHPAENVAKMHQGIPLTDEDRQGWLAELAQQLAQASEASPRVLTCSALKQKYRNQLRAAQPRLGFVFLDLDYDTALARVQTRPGHFFGPELVANQFQTLESPVGEPGVLRVDATASLAQITAQVREWLHA